MSWHSSYSGEIKDAIESKIINRGDKTALEVCNVEGIGKSNSSFKQVGRMNTVGVYKKSKSQSPKE